jgi:hypothetical protein
MTQNSSHNCVGSLTIISLLCVMAIAALYFNPRASDIQTWISIDENENNDTASSSSNTNVSYPLLFGNTSNENNYNISDPNKANISISYGRGRFKNYNESVTAVNASNQSVDKLKTIINLQASLRTLASL